MLSINFLFWDGCKIIYFYYIKKINSLKSDNKQAKILNAISVSTICAAISCSNSEAQNFT